MLAIYIVPFLYISNWTVATNVYETNTDNETFSRKIELTLACMKIYYTVKFTQKCASSLAGIIYIKRSHDFQYTTISTKILSLCYFFFPPGISSRYKKTQCTTLGHSQKLQCQWQPRSNQPIPCSLQFAYFEFTDTAQVEGGAVNVDHTEVLNERPRTLLAISPQNIKALRYSEFINISLAVSPIQTRQPRSRPIHKLVSLIFISTSRNVSKKWMKDQ